MVSIVQPSVHCCREMSQQFAELRCRRAIVGNTSSGDCGGRRCRTVDKVSANSGSLRCACVARDISTVFCDRRSCWPKACRRVRLHGAIGHNAEGVFQLTPATATPPRLRDSTSNPMGWIVGCLRSRGYAFLQLSASEQDLLDTLFAQSRAFFACPNQHKLAFKFFPLPGGYLTPTPGAHELFEFRRGLCRCPPQLAHQAMGAFRLLEGLACSVLREVDSDIGTNLIASTSEMSPALRCLHYDRPHLSANSADALRPPHDHPLAGTVVRIVGLRASADAPLNGLRTVVLRTEDVMEPVWETSGALSQGSKTCVVDIGAAPLCVIDAVGGCRCARVLLANIRRLELDTHGMYPAHTDSSLLTLAPRSSVAALEAKDLQSGEWFNIEGHMEPRDCLVIVGDALDYASAHRYPALMHRPAVVSRSQISESRISTPFFLYPDSTAVLRPLGLPQISFEDLNGNVGGCRDSFPWKQRSCYFSDLVYS